MSYKYHKQKASGYNKKVVTRMTNDLDRLLQNINITSDDSPEYKYKGDIDIANERAIWAVTRLNEDMPEWGIQYDGIDTASSGGADAAVSAAFGEP